MLIDPKPEASVFVTLSTIKPGLIFKRFADEFDHFYTIVMVDKTHYVLDLNTDTLRIYDAAGLARVYPDACLRINYGLVDDARVKA